MCETLANCIKWNTSEKCDFIFLRTIAVSLWHTWYLIAIEEKEVKVSIITFLNRLPPSCPCGLRRRLVDRCTAFLICEMQSHLWFKSKTDKHLHKSSGHSPPFFFNWMLMRIGLSALCTDNKTPFNSLSYELAFQRHCVFTGILLQKLSWFNFFPLFFSSPVQRTKDSSFSFLKRQKEVSLFLSFLPCIEINLSGSQLRGLKWEENNFRSNI